MNCPHEIDFSAWLAGRAGIDLPGLRIVIHSTEWEDRRHVCKPDTEWPDKVTYHIGEREVVREELQTHILAKAPHAIPDDRIVREYGPQQWAYNLISHATLGAMKG